MKNKIISVILVVLLLCSCILPVGAEEEQQQGKEITLSMFCNLTKKNSIKGVYKDNNFYISADDLCTVSGAKLTEQTEKSTVFSVNDGQRIITVNHQSQCLSEDKKGERLITMPVLQYNGQRYYSVLHFLRYLGIAVSIDKDAETQLKVFVRYTIFDALVEFVEMDRGNFFWWDEVSCEENEKIENKIINSGIVALINRDSNVFRMMIDAKGIEREALEDALISIITNEGESYFDENNSSLDSLNLANDVLGTTSDIAGFIVEAYKTDATKALGDFIDDFATGATTAANTAVTIINAVETMKQFCTITDTQISLLDNTIISCAEKSPLLQNEWSRLIKAAENVSNRVKSEYANNLAAASEVTSKLAYNSLQSAVSISNPVSAAWSGAVLLCKLVPYTADMINKKTQLYNAYNCSMIQLIANELLYDVFCDLYESDYMQFNVTSQYKALEEMKNALILQLKSTLTTRDYLIKSGFLEDSYASEMRILNKETAELLNKTVNCKIVPVGSDPYINEDLSWMASYADEVDKLSFVMKEENIETKTSFGAVYCTSKITYPYFSGSSNTANLLNKRYSDIINGYKNRENESIDEWYENVRESSNIDMLPYFDDYEVEVKYNKNGYISMLETNHFFTGGAHPYHDELGVTYSIQTGKEMTASHFFEGSESDINNVLNYYYLDSEAAYAYDVYDGWWKNRNFVLTEDGICFYVNVGDAVERVEILIPYTSKNSPVISAKKALQEYESNWPKKLTMQEATQIVLNYFNSTSSEYGEYVVFDNETSEDDTGYNFIVRFQRKDAPPEASPNVLAADAFVNKTTGELLVDGVPVNSQNSPAGELLNITDGQQLTLTGTISHESYEINAINKGEAVILNLDAPISCVFNSGDGTYQNYESLLESVQLSVNEPLSENERIQVTGTVMFAHTGHHIREVVLIDCDVVNC